MTGTTKQTATEETDDMTNNTGAWTACMIEYKDMCRKEYKIINTFNWVPLNNLKVLRPRIDAKSQAVCTAISKLHISHRLQFIQETE